MQLMKSGNKPGAIRAYQRMTGLYKVLPPAQKPVAYKHMLNINKQISILK